MSESTSVTVETLLTIEALSRMLGVPVPTIYAWRYRGEGPRGYKLGRHVRYRLSDVNKWLEDHADVPKAA